MTRVKRLRGRYGALVLGVVALSAHGCGANDADGTISDPYSEAMSGMGGQHDASTAGTGAGGTAGLGPGGTAGGGTMGAGGIGGADAGRDAGAALDAGDADPRVDASWPDATPDSAAPVIGECEPAASKAAEGEDCRADSECQAGLLCGDTNGVPGSCRPITGLTLLRTFRPEGRLEAAAALGGQGEYSEGMDFAHGFLWQATPYVLHQIDVDAETVVTSYGTPREIDYREGIAWRGETLLQASYRSIDIYAAELQANGQLGAFTRHRQLEGLSSAELNRTLERRDCVYGVEDQCDKFYTTRCGASSVDIYESGANGNHVGSFEVQDEGGRRLPAVEDMEIYLGQLWISTFAGDNLGYNDVLFRVDLSDVERGVAIAVDSYEISPCTTRSGAPTLALDGVAVDRATRELYVTGKDCPIVVYQVY